MTQQGNNNNFQTKEPMGLIRGRFTEATDAFVEHFTASISFDQRLYKEDIHGSIAHANMLCAIKVLSADERDAIVDGLNQVANEIESGTLELTVALEDIHMNIEHRLIELIGDTGKKLHTGRSRNDQIATDIRLYQRQAIDELEELETQLLRAIAELAERYHATVMPGFTHLQTAQPITFGHHLMAWFEMLKRDRERLRDCRKRTNVLPLGAAALAGTPYLPDRGMVAELLEFDAICANSLDAVSDRDFAIEFCATAAITLTHMSRWCEEMVMWSSQQFNFIELPDRFCTGSSIMPQKKNPDVPELIRGKSGRVNGHLVNLLTLMKSQPLTYNKDNQEDKEPLFDCVDTLRDCLTALVGLVPNIEAKEANMRAAAAAGFATATDLADYLVRKGMPFRQAHEIVAKAVQTAVQQNTTLDELSLDDLSAISGMTLETDVFTVLSLDGSVQSRDHLGGTAPTQVKAAVTKALAEL